MKNTLITAGSILCFAVLSLLIWKEQFPKSAPKRYIYGQKPIFLSKYRVTLGSPKEYKDPFIMGIHKYRITTSAPKT